MFSFTGKIQQHSGRGTDLGYPTLNLKLTRKIKFGVYAGYVCYKNKKIPAAIFVGRALSFNERAAQIEAHLLDRYKKIPVNEIKVIGITYIRKNKKFNSKKFLIKQIALDIKKIRLCLVESSKK